MRDIYCDRCGKVTMKVENGSMIRAGTTTRCSACVKLDEVSELRSIPDDPVAMLKNIFGMVG